MPSSTDLAQEIHRLHRQLRRTRVVGAIAAVAIVTLAMTGRTADQDTQSARMFFVLDENGVPRGNFGVLSNGDVGLALTDPAGAARIALRVLPNGNPKFNVLDADQNVRTEITMDAEGTPLIVMNRPDGSPKMALSTGADGTSQLNFFGANGDSRRASLGVVEDGRPFLLMWDAAGNEVFEAPGAAPAPGN